ncbi:MAG: hypothetical protein ABI353_19640, partial [Isosphaeraceae bacterium]
CPSARWRSGRASSRAFQLFGYRTFFHLEFEDNESIVVGVTCVERGPVVQISGDISREETGSIAFDEGCEENVPNEPDAVIGAADRIARILAAQPKIVVEAIQNPNWQATSD